MLIMSPWRNKTAGWVIAWFCAGVLATPILGQAPAAPANRETATLRVTTRLVQVNVIVKDKQGNPVTDLTRSDFKLFDQGKEQPISVFSVESNQTLSPPAQPLPPDTYSNRLEYRDAVPHSATVILLGGLVARPYARDQIVKFLSQLRPQDCVALYTLGGHTRVLHDFSSDAAALIRTLEQYIEEAAARMGAQRGGFGQTKLRYPAINPAIDSGCDICDALEAIAQHLSRFPGRKSLIWVTGGFYIPTGGPAWPSFHAAINRATRALNDANVAVYPVDARGLIGVPMNNAENRLPPDDRNISPSSEFVSRQASFAGNG